MKKKELKDLPVEEENPYRSDTKFKATGISYPRNISSDIGIYMGLTMACLYGNQYPKLINDRLSTSDLVGTNTCIGKHTTFDQNPELKDILDQEKHRLKSITTPKRRGLRRAPRRGCALRTLAPA